MFDVNSQKKFSFYGYVSRDFFAYPGIKINSISLVRTHQSCVLGSILIYSLHAVACKEFVKNGFSAPFTKELIIGPQHRYFDYDGNAFEFNNP